MDGLRQGLDGQRFRKPGNPFEQDMATAQNADEQA